MSNEEVGAPAPGTDRAGITGEVEVVLRDENGDIKQSEVIRNLVTQVGDQYYGERAAAGISGSPLSAGPTQVTGMRLGTGTSAALKTGTGTASIGTHITGSNAGIVTGYPISSLNGSSRRIQWQSTWAAGTATNSAITEAVITNLSPIGTGAGAAADTISRVVFTAIDKGALDTLTITWSHDLLGA